MIIPRRYQTELTNAIRAEWSQGAQNVFAVLPTGGGKTVTFTDIIRAHVGASCVVAHRQEIVSQISVALARAGVYHRVIAPAPVIKLCIAAQVYAVGKSYFSPNAQCAVAGIDTLVIRGKALASWAATVTLWVMDEGHHVLSENKWGEGVSLFKNARGLLVSATPRRADGKGLGRHADGVADALVVGPSTYDLMQWGYLTRYRLFCQEAHGLDLSGVNISAATGDYSKPKLSLAMHKSEIVGDVVNEYLRHAAGKLGVTFATDVEAAHEIADKFTAAGVPAAALSAKNTAEERNATLRKFERKELLQLVNVDLFGEGFDLPAVSVVSMARPTRSLSLFLQQIGRGLRVCVDAGLSRNWDSYTNEQRLQFIAESEKPSAVLIDHVNNVLPSKGGHGLPDATRVWSLDGREKRGRNTQQDDVTPLKTCPSCTAAYEAFLKACPECGYKPEPVGRSAPDLVEGDLTELSPEALDALRKQVDKLDMPGALYAQTLMGIPRAGVYANVKRHNENQAAQAILREAMGLWAGFQRQEGRDDSESYRKFYYTYGIDVMSAQALKTQDANELADKINRGLSKYVLEKVRN